MLIKDPFTYEIIYSIFKNKVNIKCLYNYMHNNIYQSILNIIKIFIHKINSNYLYILPKSTENIFKNL